MFVCDWKTLVENEGAGGLVIAIVWAIWTWFKKRQTEKAK